jgi:hypothetical protein
MQQLCAVMAMPGLRRAMWIIMSKGNQRTRREVELESGRHSVIYERKDKGSIAQEYKKEPMSSFL